MDPVLTKVGVKGYDKPVKTPSHATKSHVVVTLIKGEPKVIRFGQQGVTGDKEDTPRRRAFLARHAKNIAKGKSSGAFWSYVTKWS
jgi:hypothetical protein